MRFCKQPGCPNKVKYGFCEDHKPKGRTGSKNKFYGSKEWKMLRAWHISQEPLCRICNDRGQMVDHIHEIAEGGDALAVSNLQTLCRSCHEKKSDRFAGKVYDYEKVQPQYEHGMFRF
jgi:5-methylcytosine-specific restriction enzyme A